MTQQDLNQVPDGGSLRVLPSGLVIIRRKKHEWINGLECLAPERLKTKTGKVFGSKFYPSWTLERLVAWIADEIQRAGWQRQNAAFFPLTLRFELAVGLADGIEVRTIRIVGDGHYVHAYPVKD
jgi:hypothetical protein